MIRSSVSAARRDDGEVVDRKPAIKPGLHLALKAPQGNDDGRSAVLRRTDKTRRPMARSGAPAPRRGDDEASRNPPVMIRPGAHLTLKVQDTKGRAVKCTVRRTEKLQRLMDSYYARMPDVAHGTGRFLYDGGRLGGWQTAAELEMEDGDEIDFFTELLGGGRAVAAVAGPALA
ncbi:hypothetical protein ACP70R_004606 [Stipagrostis hirtigluma subsp. patula]